MFADVVIALALLTQDSTAPPAAAPPADANANEPPPEVVIVQAPAPDPRDVVRCHREAAGVGSILPRRVCTSARQDEARSEHDRAEFGRMQDRQGRGQPVRRRPDE